MASDVPLPFPLPADGRWLIDLIGPRAFRVLTAFAVPCLHYAHWQALARFWLENWTNDTTYGIDRYHCFCWTYGQAVEQFVPNLTVHRPTDRLGTPFTIEGGDWLVYPWRYGETADDPREDLRFAEEKGIRSRLVTADPAHQLMLDYPDLPAIDLSRILILAWAGHRKIGLGRAFIGRPYLNNDRLFWREVYPLDLAAGRSTYGGPISPDKDAGAQRAGQVPMPPPLDLDALARLAGVERPGRSDSGVDDG